MYVYLKLRNFSSYHLNTAKYDYIVSNSLFWIYNFVVFCRLCYWRRQVLYCTCRTWHKESIFSFFSSFYITYKICRSGEESSNFLKFFDVTRYSNYKSDADSIWWVFFSLLYLIYQSIYAYFLVGNSRSHTPHRILF